MSGKLLQGEAANVLHDVVKQYISNLFRPWKLVKAGDVSSVGGSKQQLSMHYARLLMQR
jgi:hypothetical protein